MQPKVLDISGEITGPLEFQREVDKVIRGIPTITMDSQKHFRPGTTLPMLFHHFYLRGGGIGDRICSMVAVDYMARHCPYTLGFVWISDPMLEFAKNIIDQTGRKDWFVGGLDKFTEVFASAVGRVTGRGLKASDGMKIIYAGATGAGGHLVQMGYVDHTGRYNPPDGWDYYPVIDFSKWGDQPNHSFALDMYKKYVVFTTGAVTPSRNVPGHYWNPLIEDIKARGLTPVFLGVDTLHDTDQTQLKVKFSDGCNYGEGIDLRNKTTLMEAAWIMKNSAAVIGLDNGLIQLASCTDASIVCAYNIVDPSDRRPRRRAGKWEEIYISKEELVCTGCQTHMRSIGPPHDFKYCLYGDLRCIDLIFEKNGLRFRQALDRILG